MKQLFIKSYFGERYDFLDKELFKVKISVFFKKSLKRLIIKIIIFISDQIFRNFVKKIFLKYFKFFKDKKWFKKSVLVRFSVILFS